MSLLSYDEVRPWARSIQRVVAARTMPPWFADPTVGKFRNDASLSPSEIDTILRWVVAGAPRGDTAANAEQPAPAKAATPSWRIGVPDLVITMPEPYPVPATGLVDYVYLRLETGLREDRWIRAIEVQPGDRSVVHHIDVMVCAPGCPSDPDLAALELGVPTLMPASPMSSRPEASEDAWVEGEEVEFLTSFLPGGAPLQLPDGYGRLLRKGAELILNIHYSPSGAASRDQSRVGFVFGESPKRRVISFFLDNYTLWIPAGAAEYALTSSARLSLDIELLGMTPHMHFRGRAAEVSVTPPGGAPEPLLKVPHYDFNWQLEYLLSEPRSLVSGTTLQYTLHWDNSAGNHNNPDASRDVPWGRQTLDEMASLFLTVAVPTDVELDEVFAPRDP